MSRGRAHFPLALCWPLATLCLAWGCSPPTPPPEIPVVHLGLLLDSSPPRPEIPEWAAHLAIAEAELSGVEIRLVSADTGSTPEGTTRATMRLIHQDNVVALIGPNISSLAIVAGELAEAVGVPMISPASTHPKTTAGRRFVFRTAFVDADQGAAMARFARRDLGLNTAAVLYNAANFYSRSAAEHFQRGFVEIGGEWPAMVSYRPGVDDFQPFAEALLEQPPDVLFLPNSDAEVLLQAQAVKAAGLGATLLGSDVWSSRLLADKPSLQGAFAIQHWHPEAANSWPAAQKFVATWQRDHGLLPGPIAALTYDAASLLITALETGSAPERHALREALAKIYDFPGVTGTISFRGTEGDPRKSVLVGRYEAGQVVLVDRSAQHAGDAGRMVQADRPTDDLP